MAEITVERESNARSIDWSAAVWAGIVTAFIVRNLSTGAAVLVGIVLAVLLYVLVFYLMTPVWPWFANARGWVSIVALIAFGAIVGWWYSARGKSLDEHRVVT